MKHIDVRFTAVMMQTLQHMIGKEFEKFRCEPFEYSSLVYGIVGLYIDSNVFKLENYLEVQDFFGHTDDVAIFKFLPAVDSEIASGFVDGQMNNTPIGCRIKQIRVVDENQQLFVNGVQTYDVWLTRGIIFDLEDDREISFEKSVWFSEFINVKRGYDLLKQFQPIDNFLEEWDVDLGYEGRCYRQIRMITSQGIHILQSI